MNEWYYAIGQDRHGPVAESEIKALIAAGTLRADSLVWRAGMAEWVRLDSVDGFTSDLQTWSSGVASHPAAGTERVPTAETRVPAPAAEGSTFNPYAPPSTEAPLALPPEGILEIVEPRPRLDIEYCVARAWRLTLRNFWLIIGVVLLYWLITIGFMLFSDAILGVSDFTGDARRGPGWEFRTAVSQLLQWFLGVYLGLGLIRVGLSITSGQASVSDLFSQGALLWRGVGVSILYWVVVLIGLIALLIPGFYFMVRFAFTSVALVDKNCGVFEAFEYSSRLTKGNKWRLVLLWLLCLLITIAGALALLIGLFWALPTAWLAFWFVAYRYLHRGSKDTD